MGNAETKKSNKSTNSTRKAAFYKISNNQSVLKKGDIVSSCQNVIGEDLSDIIDNQLIGVDFLTFDSIATNFLQSNFHDKSEAIIEFLGCENVVSDTKLFNFLVAIIRSVLYICRKNECKNFISWKNAKPSRDNAQILASYFKQLAGEKKLEYTAQDVRAILVSVDTLLTFTFARVFGNPPVAAFFPKWIKLVGDVGKDLPQCSLLTIEDILFLNSELPVDWQNEWRLLFSTKIHGESFARFSGQIINQGPTLIIIEEKEGYVFGAFAPASWTMNPRYFGDSSCFLFTLRPQMNIYPASNFNDNFQYLTTGQQTLPNGLGFGGCLEYFGLWLSAEFGTGLCNDSCTTFRQFKRLSKLKEFVCHNVETWGVGEPPPSAADLGERSVLDSNVEAKAMLEMAGRKTYSDGLREEPKD